MKKIAVVLGFLVTVFVSHSNAIVIEDGYCSDMISWGPYGCDFLYDQCMADCNYDCDTDYNSCIASCEGDTDCEASCDDDYMYCQDNLMYCEDDCMYMAMDCDASVVTNGYVVGNGAVVSPTGSGTFSFNLDCSNGGVLFANAQIGYNYYSAYVQNIENYCYEMYGERMICGHGQGMMNGQPIDVAWCINIDAQTITAEIDGNVICSEVNYGYIYPVIWTSPMYFDGYFGFLE